MERRFALKFMIILCGLFCGLDSYAQDKSAQFGLLYGLSVPDAPNTVPHHLFGVKGVAQITSMFTLGGYYLVSGASEGSGGNKFDYSIHGVEAAYAMPSGQGATTVGLRMGISKVHQLDTATSTKYILSPYHYGLVIAHDFNVLTWLSLGFEGSYIHLEDSKTVKSGTRFSLDSFNMINFMVSAQFRF